MDTASLILGSPRGRFFCANVGYLCSDDERAQLSYRRRWSGDALEVLAAVDVPAIARLSELELLGAMAYAADNAYYWQPPDEQDLMFARPEIVEALRPIARAVVASPHARWWSESADLANQRLVEKSDSRRDRSELPPRIRPADDRLERWNMNVGGEWWSTPMTVRGGVPATTRARTGLGALELLLEEDSMGWERARVWPLRIHGAPRVYEITDPAAWVRLVDAYPFAVPSRRSEWHHTTGVHHDWFIPDWAAVAVDYDAVHLTMTGYLGTPGIAIPLAAQSGATVLAGWDPDATFWLRSGIIAVDDGPTEWNRSADGEWSPA
ncbi:hypothetical protein [Rhodococcus sp. NPDC058514]|uniref:hypothetical protein n=1 Tax=unclassified Rhodococcus (in: high G+C Gram-positive bacteria) TaxID=192944 RepID=UPI00365F3A82